MIKKWIRDWLFGGDMADFDTMFKIAVDSHESCKKLLKSNETVLENFAAFVNRYEDITQKFLDVIQKIREENNIDSKDVVVIGVSDGGLSPEVKLNAEIFDTKDKEELKIIADTVQTISAIIINKLAESSDSAFSNLKEEREEE